MRFLRPQLTDYRGAPWTHQRRRLVVFFATFLALLFLSTAFRAADDFVVRLTFLAVFFALAAKSDIESIMCSNSDLSACISPSPIKV
jgi:hypothetical protein